MPGIAPPIHPPADTSARSGVSAAVRPRPGRSARAQGDGQRRFRPEIEGMRALAVALVVLYHAGVPGLPGGFVGVDVFFVISGYLITRLLISEYMRNGRISLSSFYLRRARRLLPALVLVILTTLVAARLLLPRLSTTEIARDGLWSSVYLSNFRFISIGVDYLASERAPSPFLHLWSLAVEEQYYIIWPVLLIVLTWHLAGRRALRSIGIALIVLAACSLAASIIMTVSHPVDAYYSPASRIWELAFGALVAAFAPAIRRTPRAAAVLLSWAGIAAIVVAAVTFTVTTPFPSYRALLPVLGAMAVIAFTRHESRLSRVLSVRPAQRIGSISYSLYLWHWPMLAIAALYVGHSLALGFNLIIVVVAVVAAALTYRYVENPIRRQQIFVRRRRHGLALVTVLTLGPAMVAWSMASANDVRGTGHAGHISALSASTGTPDRLQQLIEREIRRGNTITSVPRNLTPSLGDAQRDKPVIFTDGCHLVMNNLQNRSKACTYGDTASSIEMVMFGDSHAAHWFPAALAIANQHRWKLVELSKSSCPPFPVAAYLRNHAPYPGCTRWRDDSIARIARMRPDLVVISNSWGYCSRTIATCSHALRHVISQITRSSPTTRVAVLQDTPKRHADIPVCLSGNLTRARACGDDTSIVVHAPLTAAMRSATEASSATFVTTSRWFCADGRCPAIVGNILVNRDSNHMTTAYSTWLAPALGRALDCVMAATRSCAT